MAHKDIIDTTPEPDAPRADTPDTVAQDAGSNDSNSPYLLINRKFAPYSTNTMKTRKIWKIKIDNKVTIDTFPVTGGWSFMN